MSAANYKSYLHNHTYATPIKSDIAGGENGELVSPPPPVVYHPYSYKNKMNQRLAKKQQQQQQQAKNDSSPWSTLTSQQTKDETLLRENGIKLTLERIVDSGAEEFHDMLEHNELTLSQVNLIKDIRRRAKNKVAAQTCRKRKIDLINNLKGEISGLRDTKEMLCSQYASLYDQVRIN